VRRASTQKYRQVIDQLSARPPSNISIVAAFGAVYIVWGSTYLAIRFAIETIPPFLMAGTRFLIAGSLLYVWTRSIGAPKPTALHWRSAVIIGALMLLLGNGGVTWAEQVIPSGIAALLIATVPIWIVLIDWLWHRAARPQPRIIIGLVIGVIGAGVLTGPAGFTGTSGVDPLGALALLIATISWGFGSLYSRRAPLPSSPLLSTAMEMLAGGFLLCCLAVFTGEPARLNLDALSFKSLLCLGYLVVFGSLIGFTSYIWLLRVTSAARVSTYAFVNPLIAMFLGWAIAGEALTFQTLLAAGIIVIAVFLIVTGGSLRR
jgi:drug/metabolite transporter (DMT)-like permease